MLNQTRVLMAVLVFVLGLVILQVATAAYLFETTAKLADEEIGQCTGGRQLWPIQSTR